MKECEKGDRLRCTLFVGIQTKIVCKIHYTEYNCLTFLVNCNVASIWILPDFCLRARQTDKPQNLPDIWNWDRFLPDFIRESKAKPRCYIPIRNSTFCLLYTDFAANCWVYRTITGIIIQKVIIARRAMVCPQLPTESKKGLHFKFCREFYPTMSARFLSDLLFLFCKILLKT